MALFLKGGFLQIKKDNAPVGMEVFLIFWERVPRRVWGKIFLKKLTYPAWLAQGFEIPQKGGWFKGKMGLGVWGVVRSKIGLVKGRTFWVGKKGEIKTVTPLVMGKE